jgi:type VI secretion system Hcp family effector
MTMADNFLLTMKLTKQGYVTGSSKKKEGDLDFSKGAMCHAFTYEVKPQFDAGSGHAVGKRQHSPNSIGPKPRHKPITIRREFDAASPKLLQALATSEVFETATLSFDRTGSDGKPAVLHTIELRNGTICAIKPAMDSGGKRYEDVTLVYDSLLVNGIRDGVVPFAALGFVRP